MTYDFYIKQPMQMVELKLCMINDENPHLLNTLDRNLIHALIQKYSYIYENTEQNW